MLNYYVCQWFQVLTITALKILAKKTRNIVIYSAIVQPEVLIDYFCSYEVVRHLRYIQSRLHWIPRPTMNMPH